MNSVVVIFSVFWRSPWRPLSAIKCPRGRSGDSGRPSEITTPKNLPPNSNRYVSGLKKPHKPVLILDPVERIEMRLDCGNVVPVAEDIPFDVKAETAPTAQGE